MNTYGDELAALARPLAQLLARGRGAHSPYGDLEGVLAARDTVLCGIRSAYDAVCRPDIRPAGVSPGLAALDPARSLQVALHDLPRAAPEVAPSRAGALDYAVFPDGVWRAAAAAATALDRYLEALQQLPDPAAATAMRDLAQLSQCLLELDQDLALGLQGDGRTTTVRSLLDRPVEHGTVRAAVGGVTVLTNLQPLDRTADRLGGRVAARPIIVRKPGDLPEAAQRIAAMLQLRDTQIALRDVVVVTAALVHAATIGGEVLLDAGRGGDAEGLRLAGQALLDLRAHLAAISAARAGVATLTRPSAVIAAQCREMLAGLRGLAAPRSVTRMSEQLPLDRRKALDVLAWADELPPVCVGLERSLLAAASDRALMIPADRDGHRGAGHLWRPAGAGESMAILDRATELKDAVGSLSRALAVAREQVDRSDARGDAAQGACAGLLRVLERRDSTRAQLIGPVVTGLGTRGPGEGREP